MLITRSLDTTGVAAAVQTGGRTVASVVVAANRPQVSAACQVI